METDQHEATQTFRKNSKRSLTTTTVGTKLINDTELVLVDEIAMLTDTNRSTVMREALLWASQDQSFIDRLQRIQKRNGRTR